MQVTIADDDTRKVSLTTSNQRVWEDVGSVDVVVQLSQTSPVDVSVPIEVDTSDLTGADYSISTAPIVIPSGQLTAIRTVQIVNNFISAPSDDDWFWSSDKSITIELLQPVGALGGYAAKRSPLTTTTRRLNSVKAPRAVFLDLRKGYKSATKMMVNSGLW